jgi:uncharacterized protein YndB with AHSA1/START domain
MKVLKWSFLGLFSLIGLAVLGLFIAGSGSEAKTLRQEVVIARPPAQVFPWLAGAKERTQWVSWLVDVRPVSGERGAIGEKTVLVMDDPNMREKIEIAAETTAREENKRLASHLDAAQMFSGEVQYLLEPQGDDTKLVYEMRYEYHNWIAKLLSPIVAPHAREKARRDLAELKRLVEAS